MTRLVVVLWVRVAPPRVRRLGFLTPRHSDARPGCGNRLRSYALLRTRTMFVPRLVLYCSRAAPCESRPQICGQFHQIAIVPAVLRIGLVNRAVLWLAPLKIAYKESCAHPFSLEIHLILSPKWYLCLCRDRALLPPSTCERTGRMPPGTKKTLEGR